MEVCRGRVLGVIRLVYRALKDGRVSVFMIKCVTHVIGWRYSGYHGSSLYVYISM
jgi:hypothetical protein